ncbi:MAG: hypothetical protein B0D92_08435 [Spirochaeta sp. LUC14_002_19_P3]|nr:MAG: hypothetical protein B0D92_08435 [Spirochaeta sp. LUC14_002_19_P3]
MANEQKIIILLHKFTPTEAQAALDAYAGVGEDSSRITAAPITDIMEKLNTAKAIDAVAEGKWPGGTPCPEGRPGALIAGADKREAIILTRCFKSVLPQGADPAFAMVTKTGLTWTVGKYLAHIRKEHDFMKTANPADDPDMKAI